MCVCVCVCGGGGGGQCMTKLDSTQHANTFVNAIYNGRYVIFPFKQSEQRLNTSN